MVPILNGTDSPSSSQTWTISCSICSRNIFNSRGVLTRGTMISGVTETPSLMTMQAASTMARTCIL